MQAVLTLTASWAPKQGGKLRVTGVVLESGDGVPPVPPMAEGHVAGSCGKHISRQALAYFTQQLLKGLEVGIHPEQSLE